MFGEVMPQSALEMLMDELDAEMIVRPWVWPYPEITDSEWLAMQLEYGA